MPIPPILTPMPNAQYIELHYEREAFARLRLHLLMARLRSGLRRTLEVSTDREKVSQFTQYITDELHLGFIHIEGYRIPLPYGLQDLSNKLLEIHGIAFGTELSWQNDLDQDFNAISDKLILETTDDYFYWWAPGFEIPPGGGSVPGQVILPHFVAYYNAVVEKKYQTSLTGEPHIIPFLDTLADVPGLRVPPVPSKPAKSPAATASPLCENCLHTRELVLGALRKLRTAKANVAMHIRNNEEAAFRSCDTVNGYTALERISDVCDPFADGKDLPKQFQKLHPKHDSPDLHQAHFDFNLLRAARDPYLVSVKNSAAMDQKTNGEDEGNACTINDVRYRFWCFKEAPAESCMPLIAGKFAQGQQTGDGDSEDGSGDGANDDIGGDGESEGALSHTTSIPSEFERLVEAEQVEDDIVAEGETDEDDEEYEPELEDDGVDDGFIID